MGNGVSTVSVLTLQLENRDLKSRVAELERHTTLVKLTPSSATIIESIRSRKRTCADITDSILLRADKVNGTLNACIELLHDSARAAAEVIDAKIAEVPSGGSKLGKFGKLAGLPILVKANIDVAGTLTTAATPGLSRFRPTKSAPCVDRLVLQGAIVIGKTNMPEMAFRVDSWNRLYGRTVNPYSARHSTGGSSSGTAAGIAAGLAPCGLGSDTSGSVRLPAACCGIVGFRPSLGRWPSKGIVPIIRANDTAGPMGQSVADVALLDAVVVGEDLVTPPQDSFLKGRTFLVPTDWIRDEPGAAGIDGSYMACLEHVIVVLERAGATVVRMDGSFRDKVIKVRSNWPMGPMGEMRADLKWYLDQHGAMAPTVEQVWKKMTAAQNMFNPSDEPDKLPALIADRDAARKAQEDAYQKYLGDAGATALLVPSMACEPVDTSDWRRDKKPSFSDLRVFCFTRHLCQIPIPSIVLPVHSVKCRKLGLQALPTSIMLMGLPNCDRDLLAIAFSLEKALGR